MNKIFASVCVLSVPFFLVLHLPRGVRGSNDSIDSCQVEFDVETPVDIVARFMRESTDRDERIELYADATGYLMLNEKDDVVAESILNGSQEVLHGVLLYMERQDLGEVPLLLRESLLRRARDINNTFVAGTEAGGERIVLLRRCGKILCSIYDYDREIVWSLFDQVEQVLDRFEEIEELRNVQHLENDPVRQGGAEQVGEQHATRFDLHTQNQDVPSQVVEAAEEAGIEMDRLSISSDFHESYDVHFFDVTFEEALDFILLPHAGRWIEEEDSTFTVLTQEQWEEQRGLDEETIEADDTAVDPEEIEDDAANDEEDLADAGVDRSGVFDLDVTDLDIKIVLQILVIQSHRNMVIWPGVTGPVDLKLEGVTFDAALDHVLEIQGCRRIDVEGCVWVMTQAEWEARQERDEPDDSEVD